MPYFNVFKKSVIITRSVESLAKLIALSPPQLWTLLGTKWLAYCGPLVRPLERRFSLDRHRAFVRQLDQSLGRLVVGTPRSARSLMPSHI